MDQPCYECLKKERDALKSLLDADLAAEVKKYKTLYESAVRSCPVCAERCLIRPRRKLPEGELND